MRIWLKRLAVLIGVVLLTVFAVRAWDAYRSAPLALWETHVPPELDADALASTDWAAYVAHEDVLFADIKAEVSAKLGAADCVLVNRYCPASPIDPATFARNWNRSFVLEPAGPARGSVVLLHGLSDSPYSLRHIAQSYAAHGWVAIGLRLPGHGTVPAGLTRADWPDWRAAVRLAVREAARRAPGKPMQIVGYSNGGALALDYALNSLDHPALVKPQRLVLLSPMVGVSGFARFAGIAGWPAVFPAFAKSAWLDVLPEYNPYKYNSFPVNAAKQSYALTQVVQDEMKVHAADGSLAKMPPILLFQSLVDATVVTRAVTRDLLDRLPANGSELVLFDINHDAVFAPLIKPGVVPKLASIVARAPRRYAVTIVENIGATRAAAARRTPAGSTAASVTPLGLDWPQEIYSLSHIALPFPVSDGLYGLTPDPADHQGIAIGGLDARGEKGVLLVGPNLLMRVSSNPFFPWMLGKIEAGMETSQ